MNEKPLITAVFFDLDGTLLNTLKDIAGAVNKGLADMGYPQHPLEAFLDFVGHGQGELVRRAIPEQDRDPQTIQILGDKFWNYYDKGWHIDTKPYPGILHVIQVALAKRMKLAVFSNKAHFFTKKIIRYYFRGEMIGHTKNPFGIYSGQQPGRPSKPNPTIALELLQKMNCKPQQAALVGDMSVDIQTAKNAGMLAIGAAWGFSGKEKLITAGADLVFDTPTDLACFLETQPMV